jgi:uncharacterized damage-inducible protein DinB
MPIADSMLPEFDREMANTRRMLERVPEKLDDWKPHDRSMTLARLASHVAELPEWGMTTFTTDEMDFAPKDRPPEQPVIHETREALLAAFDRIVPKARAAIAGASDADMMKPWTLRAGGQKIFTMQKAAVLRSFVMNHIIHHRAQLQVYLRLKDIAVPGMYGPSADGEV